MGLHTLTTKGRMVEVILKDGTVVRGKFVERAKSHRWIVLEGVGRVMIRDIRAFTALKGKSRTQ